MEIVREFRDIAPRVAERYLSELPGSTDGEKGFSGPGWEAEIEELPDVPVGFLTFRRIRLTVRGEEDAVHGAWKILEPKFYRGGA
jgi:hypothetical protein